MFQSNKYELTIHFQLFSLSKSSHKDKFKSKMKEEIKLTVRKFKYKTIKKRIDGKIGELC